MNRCGERALSINHGKEVINKRKNGQLYYESLHITPVNNVHGEISHFIAIKKGY